jgi:hypothetical protein
MHSGLARCGGRRGHVFPICHLDRLGDLGRGWRGCREAEECVCVIELKVGRVNEAQWVRKM